VCHSRITRGRSVGKWAIGLRVIDHESGEAASALQVIVFRNVVATAIYGLCGWGAFAVIDILTIFRADGRRIKDRFAGTRVVDDARDIPG
jgi:uncharacterized RDD family membrane protein YckC